MHSAPFLRIRRFATALLLLCLGLFSAETLIADVHDGDGMQVHASAVEGPAHAHGSGESSPEGERGHAMHVCHCLHAHMGAPSRQDVAVTPAPVLPTVIGISDHAPESVGREPQFRPPIA